MFTNPIYQPGEELTDHVTVGFAVFISEMPNKLKKVYELEGVICDLHSHFTAESGSTMGISKSKATELISSTIFDYEPNSRYLFVTLSCECFFSFPFFF